MRIGLTVLALLTQTSCTASSSRRPESRPRDTTHPPVWTFFPDPAYTRFVIVMSWKDHTIDQLLDQWRQLPLGG